MMSDGSLSQDEIDALLFQGGADTGDAAPAAGNGALDLDTDNLLSLLDKSKGAMGETLSGMLGKTVTISLTGADVTSKDAILGELPDEGVEVKLDYSGDAPGDHLYFLNSEDSVNIAGLMSGQEGVELDAMALASIGEAVSQITGTLLTNIEREVGKNVTPTAPEAQSVPKAMVRFPDGEFVKIGMKLAIEGDGEVTLTEIFDSSIVSALTPVAEAAAAMAGAPMGQPSGGQPMGQPMGSQMMGQPMGQPMGGQMMGQPMGGQMMGQPMGGQMMGQPMGQMNPMMGQMGMPQNVSGVQYPNLSQVDMSGVDSRNIGLLMDVSMELTVELGRTKWQIKDILGIGEGTIIELDKLAGEPVDILVNKNLIARGEVVVIDENFGVRVTEIVSAGAKAVEE